MIHWLRQGAAVVGELHLPDGAKARIVLVGARENPKGAVVVLPGGAGAALKATPLQECLDSLSPAQVVEVACMQERIFGDSSLPAPKNL